MSSIVLLFILVFSVSASASNFDIENYNASLNFAQVENVLATKQANGTWCFGTSVRHKDDGWDHYANSWEVIDLAGNQLDSRILHHPHVNEQPFTRSKCNIHIPAEMLKVIVRAKCNKHGFGGKVLVVALNHQ